MKQNISIYRHSKLAPIITNKKGKKNMINNVPSISRQKKISENNMHNFRVKTIKIYPLISRKNVREMQCNVKCYQEKKR